MKGTARGSSDVVQCVATQVCSPSACSLLFLLHNLPGELLSKAGVRLLFGRSCSGPHRRRRQIQPQWQCWGRAATGTVQPGIAFTLGQPAGQRCSGCSACWLQALCRCVALAASRAADGGNALGCTRFGAASIASSKPASCTAASASSTPAAAARLLLRRVGNKGSTLASAGSSTASASSGSSA